MTVLPNWLKDRIGLGVPIKVPMPWWLRNELTVPRRWMLAVGCKAVYRVWQKQRRYAIEHFVRIESVEELDEMIKALKDNNWSATFLWFYEYISWEEWTLYDKLILEEEKERARIEGEVDKE